MIKTLIFVACLLVGSQTFAQYKSTGFFKPEAGSVPKAKLTEGLTFDSTATTQNILHVITAVGYSTGNQLMAGTGGVLLHQRADGNGGWTTPYGVGAVVWALGSVAPSASNTGGAFAVGPVITVLNGWVTVGGAYDFVDKKYIGVINLSYTFLK